MIPILNTTAREANELDTNIVGATPLTSIVNIIN